MPWASAVLLMLNLLCKPGAGTCPDPRNVARLHELAAVGAVIAESPTEEDATALIAIAFFESGYKIHAVGPFQEWGLFQIRGFTRHQRVVIRAMTLRQQAREALRRLHAQGWCGYAGETPPHCPKGDHRRDLATRLLRDYRRTRTDGEGQRPLESWLDQVPEGPALIGSVLK